jgi:branched-chain amino acid transport system permease protein
MITALVSLGSASLRATLLTAIINLVLVIGLYTFVGNSGVLSFGHGAMMAVGGYTMGILTMPAEIKPAVLTGLPGFIAAHQFATVPAIVISGFAAAIFAAVVGIPLARMAPLQAGLATVAMLLVVRIVLQNWTSVTGGGPGLAPVPFADGITAPFLWLVLALVLAYVFQSSSMGLRLQASREDDIAARSVGIRVARERWVAFVLSGFITGIGGALFVQSVGAATPDSFYITPTFLILVMLVVGGITTLTGAVIGSIVISTASHVLSDVEQGDVLGLFNLPAKAGTRDLILSLMMLGILLLRPQGLVGGREFRWPILWRERSLSEAFDDSGAQDPRSSADMTPEKSQERTG